MRRKHRVWWAPQEMEGTVDIVLSGNSGNFQGSQPIIADDTDDAASESGAPANLGRFGALEDVVVKRVVGKLHQSFVFQFANSTGSLQEQFMKVVMRWGIAVIPRNPDGTLASTMTDNLWSLSPAAAGAPVQAGSGGPRWLWRRNFYVSQYVVAEANKTGFETYNDELFCPPGPYVDFQPNCHVKQNQVLTLVYDATISSATAVEGTTTTVTVRSSPSLKALLTRGVR